MRTAPTYVATARERLLIYVIKQAAGRLVPTADLVDIDVIIKVRYLVLKNSVSD